MREIALTQGKVALVDDEDFERLSQFNWCAYKSKKTWYAMRAVKVGHNAYRCLDMHRDILGLQFGDGVKTDHRDGNGLNNLRANIRRCSSLQNRRNFPGYSDRRRSNFKGVSYDKNCPGRPWRVRIRIGTIRHYVGRFDDEQAAAVAYNEAATIHFGEFAWLNKV
jgi:hypothetical protein